MKKAYLECAKVINTHGVAGAVKLDSLCDTPETLAGLKTLYLFRNNEYLPIKPLKTSVFKRFVIAVIEGIDTIDAAEALRDTMLYAKREDLPTEAGDRFIADLIGLPIIDAESGRVYGKLTGVFNVGASDIYEIDTPDGLRMMPAVSEFVREIDDEKGIFVTPIEGMFDQ